MVSSAEVDILFSAVWSLKKLRRSGLDAMADLMLWPASSRRHQFAKEREVHCRAFEGAIINKKHGVFRGGEKEELQHWRLNVRARELRIPTSFLFGCGKNRLWLPALCLSS